MEVEASDLTWALHIPCACEHQPNRPRGWIEDLSELGEQRTGCNVVSLQLERRIERQRKGQASQDELVVGAHHYGGDPAWLPRRV